MSRALLRRHWYVIPLLLILLLVLLWDWNWFRPLVERKASAAAGREITIDDLDVDLGRETLVTLSGIRVENPEEFGAASDPVAAVNALAVRVGVRDLFDKRLRLVSIDVDAPAASLRANAKGTRNWQFELPEADTAPKPDAKPWDVQIEALTIRDGTFLMIDPALKADLKGTIRTLEGKNGAEPQIRAEVGGKYDGNPFKALFLGGSVLGLRTSENPYKVDLKAESGDANIALKGTLLDPMQFGGAKLRLLLQGQNLSTLSALTHLPLPNTPPYRLEGALDYSARRVLFNDFKGLMGESDLAGDISVLVQKPRPKLTAKVASKQMRLEDFSGLIGGNPNAPDADAPNGDGRLLPSKPISVPNLQQADVDVSFKGDKIVGNDLPFDRLSFKLTLDDGVMRASPADLGIGEGSLRLYATLDPRGEQLGIEAKAELRRIDVSALMKKTGYQGSGRIGGLAELKSKGRSASELFGNGDGELKLAMAGGDFSGLLLDLAGLDFGNALLSALGIGARTEVRCLVGDFALDDGKLDTRSFVLDTGNTNLLLKGGANFKDESLGLRLSTQPKRANIGRLKAPINIGGTFVDPKIRPDFVDLGVRAGAAVALGVLLTPLAAILPTLQLGPGEDRNCQALLAEAEVSAPPQPAAPPAPKK